MDAAQPIKRAIDRMRFQIAIDRPMKDHVTSLHLTIDVFKISFNNASVLFSLVKERFAIKSKSNLRQIQRAALDLPRG